jgi:hypothetical protein
VTLDALASEAASIVEDDQAYRSQEVAYLAKAKTKPQDPSQKRHKRIAKLFSAWSKNSPAHMRFYASALIAAARRLNDRYLGATVSEHMRSLEAFCEGRDWRDTAPGQELVGKREKFAISQVAKQFGASGPGPSRTTGAPRSTRLESAFAAFGAAFSSRSQADVALRPKHLLRPEQGPNGTVGHGARLAFVRRHTRHGSLFVVHGIRIAPHFLADRFDEPNVLYFSETYRVAEGGQLSSFHRSEGVCFLDGENHLTAIARPQNKHFITQFVGEISDRGEKSFDQFPALMSSRNGHRARFAASGLCLRCADKEDEERKTGCFEKSELLKLFRGEQRAALIDWIPRLWSQELAVERAPERSE